MEDWSRKVAAAIEAVGWLKRAEEYKEELIGDLAGEVRSRFAEDPVGGLEVLRKQVLSVVKELDALRPFLHFVKEGAPHQGEAVSRHDTLIEEGGNFAPTLGVHLPRSPAAAEGAREAANHIMRRLLGILEPEEEAS